jgi:anion-transporting  ArsA/GET3 family ATPase
MVSRSRVFTYLTAATPGLKELLTIGKIWELAQLDRKVRKARKYDLVLVDAPATGHGIGFMQTPRTFASIARVGPIHAQAEAIGAFITDAKQTGAAIVSLPEEMAVNESDLLERELTEEVGVAVDRVYMNGMYPERVSDDEAELLRGVSDSVEGGARGAVRAALSERRRATAHRAQLARLEELVRTPVETLPFIFEPQLGVAGLERLAAEVA